MIRCDSHATTVNCFSCYRNIEMNLFLTAAVESGYCKELVLMLETSTMIMTLLTRISVYEGCV